MIPYQVKLQDGYTEEVTGPEGVQVLVATRAKPTKDPNSPLDREFYKNFLDVYIFTNGCNFMN